MCTPYRYLCQTRDPIAEENVILRISELAVIISLMVTGLKIDKNFNIRNYRIPLLMILITMIGCIVTVALAGWWIAGLVPGSACLIGAVFAPTDPVIADDIQVDFEEKGARPVQFSLTAEAGLNDGMAFPFTWFAIWMATSGLGEWDWLNMWFLKDVLYRIVSGGVGGFLIGRLIAYLLFKLPCHFEGIIVRKEFVVIAITLLVYGLIEAISGYGFIAVFIAGLTIRQFEREHTFHKRMHDFGEQFEQILLGVILVFLGGYIVTYMFQVLLWEHVLIVLLFIFVIRPVFGWLPVLGRELKTKEKGIVAFMGMKGVGSVFYLSFALHETSFAHPEKLWASTAFLIFTSVIVHGSVSYYVKE